MSESAVITGGARTTAEGVAGHSLASASSRGGAVPLTAPPASSFLARSHFQAKWDSPGACDHWCCSVRT
jgi:hypothetical protein